MPRKLLTIAHSYVVAMNRRLVREMARAGGNRWEITAVAPDVFHGANDLRSMPFEPADDSSYAMRVVPARLTRRVHCFYYDRKIKTILNQGFDLIHAWEEPYIHVGWQIARWAPEKSKLVYRSAQSINKSYPPPFGYFERRSMQRASGWICSGNLVADCLRSRPMYAKLPMRQIPLGVDVDAFKPNRAAAEQVLQKLNWRADGPPIVGYLGRFVPAKGLQLLMDALDAVESPWRAMFVGAGPMEKCLRAFAARHDERVRICTDVRHDAVPAHLSAMNILCAPSETTKNWREQFGRMLIEAFATGVAVIGSDSGEIPFVIGDGGVVCPERDLPAWIAAIERLVSTPSARDELTQRGLARARERFAWPIVAAQYIELFDQLCETRR